MKYTNLPNTDIKVSKICLGTMTWGEQNTEVEGHQQIELALDKGVNFLDTAEMYAVPARPETQGRTEEIIGTWLNKTKRRDEIVLASKIAGPGEQVAHIREKLDYSREALEDALDKSLKRLQTDVIDLYQLHWPERQTNFFGKRGFSLDEDEGWKENFEEVLSNLQYFVKKGKIKYIGLSNETPYGLMRFLEESKKDLPRVLTVQNPYNLLNRKDEIGLTEILHREKVGYLPYSPLGMGVLTGKHLDGIKKNSRLDLFPQYKRYSGDQAVKATREYSEIAKKHGLSFAQMSLAFINQQPFVTSNIVGATNLDQLAENIGSIDLELSSEILEEINAVHERIPNPAP
ncbi:MAG: aldo/keto reductase [Salegentibacter sp.]|uniref:Protein tas n=1 Tax=Salegentibacter flavus TaxID=287099 RepID=A0A1I4XKB2_9FLAO|nr:MULTISPECIES: aldo/keto reductase [Salegentibacter]MDR9455954.1 aldo/keto reductase [Salegentibacter sp.]SFN25700.1 Predicted oxidoreductase [Salegentibacter flavus]